MKVRFSTRAIDDMIYWAETDAKLLAKIFKLIADVRKHPFTGLGKPEALRHRDDNCWSRRIDKEHRLVYRISGKEDGQLLEVVQCRHHY